MTNFHRKPFSGGVFAPDIGYRAIPQGQARVRTILTAAHTRGRLSLALEILENVG